MHKLSYLKDTTRTHGHLALNQGEIVSDHCGSHGLPRANTLFYHKVAHECTCNQIILGHFVIKKKAAYILNTQEKR